MIVQWWREEVSEDVAPDLCPSCVSYLRVRATDDGRWRLVCGSCGYVDVREEL